MICSATWAISPVLASIFSDGKPVGLFGIVNNASRENAVVTLRLRTRQLYSKTSALIPAHRSSCLGIQYSRTSRTAALPIIFASSITIMLHDREHAKRLATTTYACSGNNSYGASCLIKPIYLFRQRQYDELTLRGLVPWEC